MSPFADLVVKWVCVAIQTLLNLIALLLIELMFPKFCPKDSVLELLFIFSGTCFMISFILLLSLVFRSDEIETVFGTFYALVAFLSLVISGTFSILYAHDCFVDKAKTAITAASIIQIINSFLYLGQVVHSCCANDHLQD